MLRDELSPLTIEQTIDPVVLAGDGTTTNGATVDGANCNVVYHIVSVGESADTLSGSLKQTAVLQDSDNGSDWAFVANADFVIEGTNASFLASDGSFAIIDGAADDDKSYAIGYRGSKRYTRVNIVRTGNNANGMPGGAIAVKYLRTIPAAS